MTQPEAEFDVVVAGGGAAGCAAAVAAARCGARTLLLERYGFLGGAATNAQVLSYCGFYRFGPGAERTVAGVGDDVLAALRAIGAPTEPTLARSGNWIIQIDPEATKLALDRVVAASGAQVWMHALVVDARMDDASRIGAITVASHAGQRSVRAPAFVDASGEATLSVLAGVPLTHDSRRDGGQPASYPVRIGGVARDAVVDRELLTRLIAEHNAGASVPIPRADGGVLVRLPLSGDFWSMAIDLRTNGLDPDDLAAAERLGREQAWQLVTLLRRHPGFEQAHLLATGPQVGVRETRRPLSRQDVQAADLRSGRQRGDGIARASWPMEVHHGPGRASFEPVGGAGHADVPLGALRADGVDNLLLAGRVVGCDAQAYGSLRVMGTGFATGHAAGVAAARIAARADASGGPIDVAAVRGVLKAQGALV